MFRCAITNKLSRQGDPRIGAYYYIDEKVGEDTHSSEKIHRITVKTREKIYTRKIKNEETNKWEDVEVGRGWEIAREVIASQEGANLWASWSDDQRAAWLKLHP